MLIRRLRHFESNPDAAVVLVLRRRNWFPARLVGYTPVKTVEEHEARKKDEWAVILHPSEQSTGEEAVTRVGAKSIMYLSDPRVATCAVSVFSVCIYLYKEQRVHRP